MVGEGSGGGTPHPKELFDRWRSETEGVQTETKCWFVCLFVLNIQKTRKSEFSTVKRYVLYYNWNCCYMDIISLSKASKLYRFRT